MVQWSFSGPDNQYEDTGNVAELARHYGKIFITVHIVKASPDIIGEC